MPTDLKPGLRVVHPRHGPGTITAVHADAVEVEHDDQDTVRRYVLAMCTLTTEDGTPLAKPAALPPAEHPPTEQRTKPPTALDPKETAMPAKPIKAIDNLLEAMDAVLLKQGHGARNSLAAAVGLKPGSHRNWRKAGRIPTEHRAAVTAWINSPRQQPFNAIGNDHAAAKLLAKNKPTLPPIVSPHHLQTVRSLCEALSIPLTDAWLPEGDTMRKVRVLVLPA